MSVAHLSPSLCDGATRKTVATNAMADAKPLIAQTVHDPPRYGPRKKACRVIHVVSAPARTLARNAKGKHANQRSVRTMRA